MNIIVERDIPCKVRDGVTLYANIYRPQAEGKFPVLLSRLPYNKNLPNYSHRYLDPIRLALDGYIVIIQDVRGRYASEGEFNPVVQEVEDGYDTVEWAAQLPYANGKVGMFGLSYYGVTQLLAALEQPPSLKAIFPAMTASQLSHGLTSREGIHELAFLETWFLDSVGSDYLKRKSNGEIAYERIRKENFNDLNRIDDRYREFPIEEWPPIKKHPFLNKLFKQYLNQDYRKAILEKVSRNIDGLSAIDLPAYHMTGWYDSHLGTTLLNYEEMKKAGTKHQRLLIGPWAHGDFDSDIGERSFGIESAGDNIAGKEDLTSLHLKWFDCWLKENHASADREEAPVHIFVMGVNQWRAESAWPLEGTSYTPFYLHSDGKANTDITAGRLNRIQPGIEAADQFTYDPEKPVPTTGGGTLFFKGRNTGPLDQSKLEARADVLTYTSAPLQEALEVTGYVTAILYVSSDAPDTDFTAKLVDVCPDGTAYNLTDGIVRAQHLKGAPADEKVQPEKVTRLEIDLWATSNVFLPGHSIRVEISSSNFPRFAVNPNTGHSVLNTNKLEKATQTVYHQSDYPSHILLPVINR